MKLFIAFILALVCGPVLAQITTGPVYLYVSTSTKAQLADTAACRKAAQALNVPKMSCRF